MNTESFDTWSMKIWIKCCKKWESMSNEDKLSYHNSFQSFRSEYERLKYKEKLKKLWV